MIKSSEILSSCKKLNNVEQLIDKLDSITDIIRMDVYTIIRSKNILIPDYDGSYLFAINALKVQLDKKHLKATKEFFDIGKLEDAVSWLIERLTNNMRNSIDNRYKDNCLVTVVNFDENLVSVCENDNLIEQIDLEKVDREVLKKALTKTWNDSRFETNFDFEDLVDLCETHKFNIKDIVEVENITIANFKRVQVESGSFQLELDFDSLSNIEKGTN